MPQQEIIAILLSELEEAAAPLAAAFSGIAAAADGSQALRDAIAAASAQVDCIRAAAEAGGLLGLEVIGDRLRDNLQLLTDTGQEQRAASEELLLAWPERVMAYLLQPDSASACRELAQLLCEPAWPLPFSDHEAGLVLELLTAAAAAGGQQSERSREIGPDDVSLTPSGEVHPEVLAAFLDDAPRQAAELARCIHGLERAADLAATLNQARRIAHTLKGAAAVAGVAGVTNLTHHLEDLFEYLAASGRRPGRLLMDSLCEAADCLEAMIDALTGLGAPPANALAVLDSVLQWAQRMDRGELERYDAEPATAPPAYSAPPELAEQPAGEDLAPAAGIQSLRVPVATIDALYRYTGELSISGAQLAEGLARLERLQRALAEQDQVVQQRLFELEDLIDIQDVASAGYRLGPGQSGDDAFDPLELDQYNQLHGCSRALTEAVADWRELSMGLHDELARLRNLLNQQDRLHRALEGTVLAARLVSVRAIEARLQRFVRQACRATGKQAELEIAGVELPLDSELLQALVDPLGHLLRNAVDHGIEAPQERLAAGKPETGRISLSFTRDGNHVQIVCSDDGRGFDLDAIRQRAAERGLLAAADGADAEALQRLLLLPGFSTRQQVTHTSGRGIGLDAVHAAVRALNGTLSLHAVAGQGARFTLRLPTALVTVHALLVEAGGQVVAIPSGDLAHIPAPGSWQRIESPDGLRFQSPDLACPLRPLAAAMGRATPPAPDGSVPPVLLAHIGDAIEALEVERLIGSTHVVIKHFGAMLPRVRGVLGAAILGDGTVAPVLDLTGLLQGPPIAVQPAEILQPPSETLPEILVVDDSLSMRRALGQFLQDAGFRVRFARDGMEAIQAVERQQPDLLIVDLEMPRLNGLELTAHLRGRAATAALPVIMLTSRSMQKHRRQAELAGVDAYLTKPFQELELLATVERLLPASQPA